MAETGGRFSELEMKMVMEKMPQRILVSAMAALVFAVGFIVRGDALNEVPVMIRHVGFLAFMFSFLCCVVSICIYMNLRSEYMPPTWKLSLWTLSLAMAAVTLVIGMYAVLTHSSYTRLWISVTVVGLVCFPILTYVVYAMAMELTVGIAIASAIARLFNATYISCTPSPNSNN